MLPLDTIGGNGGLDTTTGNRFAESGKKLCICWYISLHKWLYPFVIFNFGENVQF